jgi:hypothetical protein
MMPPINENAEGRTRRLRELVSQFPALTPLVIAEATGRNPKTVSMWLRGRPQAIPALALQVLEFRFGASQDKATV